MQDERRFGRTNLCKDTKTGLKETFAYGGICGHYDKTAREWKETYDGMWNEEYKAEHSNPFVHCSCCKTLFEEDKPLYAGFFKVGCADDKSLCQLKMLCPKCAHRIADVCIEKDGKRIECRKARTARTPVSYVHIPSSAPEFEFLVKTAHKDEYYLYRKFTSAYSKMLMLSKKNPKVVLYGVCEENEEWLLRTVLSCAGGEVTPVYVPTTVPIQNVTDNGVWLNYGRAGAR